MNDDRRKRRAIRAFRSNTTAVVGLLLMAVFVVTALAARWIAPYDPRQQSVVNRLKPPGSAHLLGTDDYGRDVFSRIVHGSQVSLLVAFASVAAGGSVGVVLGVLTGYLGGPFDHVLTGTVDMLLSFPNLILGLLFLVIFGSGLPGVTGAIAISMVPRFARLARGPTLSARQKEYVEACRALGADVPRIVFRHILPNILGPLVIAGSLWMASAILLEANLSFLGLGVRPPTPTWGNMIRDGTEVMFKAPWLAIAPGIAIMLSVMAFNMLGDGLRDVLDPRTQG